MLVAAASAVTLVVALVAVWSGPDIAPLPDGERQPEAVSFSDRAMWDERKLGMTRVAGVELRGDTAVVAGDTAGGSRLAAVDVRSGAPHWVVDTGSPLRGGAGATAAHDHGHRAEHLRSVTGEPAVADAAEGDGDGWTVFIPYTEGRRGRETEIGVAALSGADGSVRWKRPLIKPRPGDKGDEDRGKTVRILAANQRAVLAGIEERQGTDPKTYALDPATGLPRWESGLGWAYRFAGDLVIGETRGDRAPSPTSWGREIKGTAVFAVDLKTGRKRWNLEESFHSSHLAAAAGGTAVLDVRETVPGRSTLRSGTVLIDAETGRTAKKADRLHGCEDDGESLIACTATRGRLVTFRPGADAEPVTTEQPVFDEDTMPRVRMIRQDRIFVGAPSAEGGPEPLTVVDRAANPLGTGPGGEISALSEHAAAFLVPRPERSSSSPTGLVVHAAAVGGEPAEPSAPGGPALRPPRIDAAPLWTATAGAASGPEPALDTELRTLRAIELAGDAVVYVGRSRKDGEGDRLVVAEAATGAERWSAGADEPLGGGAEMDGIRVPLVVHADGEQVLLVRYAGPGDQEGVAALALADGAVRWKEPTLNGDGFTTLRAADDTAFAVTVTRPRAPQDERDETVVYSTETREKLWSERGVRAETVAGGLVFAAESVRKADRRRERVDLIAYGASDGKRRWRLGDRYPEPELLHDAGGATIVIGTAGGGAVLDRATGRELAGTGAPLRRCDGDGDTLIVCQAGPDARGRRDQGSRAVTIRTRDGATKVSDLLETGFLERYGAIGDWFTAIRPAAGTGEGRTPEKFLVLDGAGRLLSDDLPGRPRAIGDRFAVLTPSGVLRGPGGAGVPNFTVHRVRR